MYASAPESRFGRHPVLTGLAIAFVLLVTSVALAEVLLALLRPPQRPWLEAVAPSRHVQLREYPPDTRTYFSATPARHDAPGKPRSTYLVVTDGDGCIRPSNLHAEPDLSLVFLGGSTTEGALIEAGRRWPEGTVARLEEILGLKINGCNAGRSGANVVHSTVKLLAAFVPLSVDVAVLKHGINDMGLLTRRGTYWPADEWHFSQVRTEEHSVEQGIRVLRNTLIPRLYEAIREPREDADTAIGELGLPLGLRQAQASPLVLPLPHASGEPRTVAARLEAFERALVSFVGMAKAWGIEPVLVTQYLESESSPAALGGFLDPDRLARLGLDAESVGREHDLFNATVRTVAQSEDTALVDLAAHLIEARRREPLDAHAMTYDGMHYHEAGAGRAARFTAESLAPIVERVRRARSQPWVSCAVMAGTCISR